MTVLKPNGRKSTYAPDHLWEGMMTIRRLGLLAPVAAVSLTGCGINSVPTAEEQVNAAWSNLQADYQRRADLIPNVVLTAQQTANVEKGILVGVTEARAKATAVQLNANDLGDPAKVQAFQAAQAQIGSSLSRLIATVEAYPQPKSPEAFRDLIVELEGTENRINVSRHDYNESVRQYNTLVRTFPSAIGAKIFYGAKPKVAFEASTSAQTAPQVNFGNAS
jgi:LemA protein